VKNLDYRSFWKSSTGQFAFIVWLSFVALLVNGYVTADHLVSITMTVIGGWVVRDGVGKGAEAMRDKNAPTP